MQILFINKQDNSGFFLNLNEDFGYNNNIVITNSYMKNLN